MLGFCSSYFLLPLECIQHTLSSIVTAVSTQRNKIFRFIFFVLLSWVYDSIAEIIRDENLQLNTESAPKYHFLSFNTRSILEIEIELN